MPSLTKRVEAIERRNRKVELDKAWETSWTRAIVLSAFTYIVVLLFFIIAGLPNPYVNSIIPALAFILSTFSLPLFKRIWVKMQR